MILAGDIGGTKTVLALCDANRAQPGRQGAPALVERDTYPSRESNGLEAIAADFLARVVPAGAIVETACFGIAGPVIEGRCETPNLPWIIDAHELEVRLGVPRVVLINDLVATAEGTPVVRPDELATLQMGDPPRQPAARALVAAGTGLGMAILAPERDGWRVLPSEGGHADWAPRNRDEVALLEFLREEYADHVSIERAVCGPALLTLYRFLVARGVGPRVDEVERAATVGRDAAVATISRLGLSAESAVCAAVLDWFARLYGAVAGNLALTALAVGGVWLGGGVSAKVAAKLAEGAFMEAFLAKGRFRGLLERVPVHVLLNPDTALWGAARRALAEVRTGGVNE